MVRRSRGSCLSIPVMRFRESGCHVYGSQREAVDTRVTLGLCDRSFTFAQPIRKVKVPLQNLLLHDVFVVIVEGQTTCKECVKDDA